MLNRGEFELNDKEKEIKERDIKKKMPSIFEVKEFFLYSAWIHACKHTHKTYTDPNQGSEEKDLTWTRKVTGSRNWINN